MSGSNDPGDPDSGVRVVVTPSQSSYFAGESFSVTITFTNTRSPESPPARSHRRGAHSISSAPLARPPTSPGTPRTAVPTFSTPRNKAGDAPVRKGLIGKSRPSKGPEELPELLEQSRKRLLARSLSVEIAPHELAEDVPAGDPVVKSPATIQRIINDARNDSPISSTSSSPSTRSSSQPIPSNHPHARKQSVFDGQLPLEEMRHAVSPSPYPPSASNSAFSLSLDPIAEGSQSPYPPTPAFPSPKIDMATPTNAAYPPSIPPPVKADTHAYPPRPTLAQPRRPSQLGLGHGPPPSHDSNSNTNLHVPPRTAFSSSFPQPNTELILYSYVQLTGTVYVMPLPGTVGTPEQAYTLNSVRSSLLRRSVVGGGSMDITSSLHPHQNLGPPSRRRSHSRSSSFSSNILSLLSSSSSTSLNSQKWSPGHRPKTQSVFSGFLPTSSSASSDTLANGGVGLGLGLGISAQEEEIDPELPLPVFEVQPSMLAVDLSLGPGESRSYTYTIPLPENLPPTFKGRSLRFSYELIIGTCRAGSSSAPGSTGANSISRVMKVPIRVYNYVVVGRQPRAYDLLWPVARRKTSTTDSGAKVEGVKKLMKGVGKAPVSSPLPAPHSAGFEDVQEYARRLLASFPDPDAKGVRMKLPAEAVSPIRGDLEREAEGALTGCREAVEILTRNPKKVSYDVNKNGVKVAVLTFTKSAYRLGETVLGVVELNDRKSRARVLTLSAMLEAQETLPSSISPASNSRHMRRVHAEHHSSFVLSTVRTTFSLDIPSDASPAFQIKIGGDPDGKGPVGGLEWKVRLCLLVAVAAETSHTGTEGVRFKHLIRDGPRGEWGSSWRAADHIAPLEHPDPRAVSHETESPQSWTSYLATSILGMTTDSDYHDGDEDLGEEEMYDGEGDVDYGGGDDGWRAVKVETVECEVPIKVWPGNTAFKAMEVVFDV